MTRIPRLPDQATISGFRHRLDFYLWKGIPCVRKWPKKPTGARSPATQPAIQRLAYSSWLYKTATQAIVSAYDSISSNTGLSNKDYFVRAYTKGIEY